MTLVKVQQVQRTKGGRREVKTGSRDKGSKESRDSFKEDCYLRSRGQNTGFPVRRYPCFLIHQQAQQNGSPAASKAGQRGQVSPRSERKRDGGMGHSFKYIPKVHFIGI